MKKLIALGLFVAAVTAFSGCTPLQGGGAGSHSNHSNYGNPYSYGGGHSH